MLGLLTAGPFFKLQKLVVPVNRGQTIPQETHCSASMTCLVAVGCNGKLGTSCSELKPTEEARFLVLHGSP